MSTSSRTISELARFLQVPPARAAMILDAVDQVRASATFCTEMTHDAGLSTEPAASPPAFEVPARSEEKAPSAAVFSEADGGSTFMDPRYEDLGLLGQGGVGDVRRVRDRHFDRVLAMKILRAGRDATPMESRLFLREARIEARLQHPGVPPIYDHGELPDGRPWYTMKEVQGERLADAIRTLHEAESEPTRFALLLRQLIRSFEAVCSTVAYAHGQGVVHRDIKPANIMLGAFGEVLLLDWGLAVHVSAASNASSKSMMVVGTPSYMSPEQARGDGTSIAPGTDIYALGATLYHILVGAPPYQGGTSKAVLERVRNSEGPAPILVGASSSMLCPEELVRLCEVAMRRDPDQRLSSASAMADALKEWLDSAERDERGHQEVVRARGLGYSSRAERERAVALWQDASRLIEQDGSARSDGWNQWLASKAAFAAAHRLEEQRTQALEASLAHSPSLSSAHELLAWHYANTALKERERGAIDGARRAWSRVIFHLDALPSDREEGLRVKLETHRRAPLYLERARRGSLIGRTALLATLSRLHTRAERFVVLHGEPGVGKSSLMVEHGLRLLESETTPVYANLQNISDEASVRQSVERALEDCLTTSQRGQSVLELVGTLPILLLLDNIDQCGEPVVTATKRWLQSCPALQVVCTGRMPPDSDAALEVRVPRLERLAAVDLLIRHALRADPDLDLAALDRDSLVGVVERLDGIPLALELAAARLVSFRLDELRARLDRRLDLLRSDEAHTGGLDAAMAISWDSLTTTARMALMQASVFRSGMDRTAAERVLQLPGGESAVVNSLEELTRHNLLRASRSDDDRTRYVLSGPVWSWADTQLQAKSSEQERHALIVRHAEYFATMAPSSTDRAVEPLRRSFELENFVVAALYGPPEAAVQCAQLACDVLNTKGPIVRGIELMKRLLERVDLGRSQRRTILILLGRGLRNAGRMDDARRCLSEAHALGDEQGQVRAATAAGNPATVAVAVAEALASGVVAADEHRYEDARMIYRRALMGAQGLGDGVSQAKAYAGLSMLPPLAGRMDRTQEHFQMAVELARAHADEQLALKTIGNYGLALFRREQLDEALACFAEAEAGHRRSENHHAVAAFSMNQGILLQRLGRLAASDQAFDRALEACEAGGDLRIRASVLGAKASLALKRGQYARAFRLANEALEWQWSNGDRSMARRTQRLLAGICIDTGQLVRAQQYLDALVPKSGEVREPAERLSTDINRAVLMLCSDQSDVAACRLLEAVVEEAEELELTPVVVLAMVNLGEGLEQMGLHSRAEASFASALSMSRETFPALSGIAMAALAVVAARAGNAKRARSLLRESSELVGNWTFERLRWQLRAGVVALLVGEDIEALECLHKVRREMRSLGLGAQTSLRHLFVFLEASLRERRSELSVTIERTSMDASAQQSAVLAALAELALLEQEAGQFETSERLLDRTEQMARELQHGGFLARIAHQRLDIARERGRYDEARVHGAVALEHARTAADHPLEARIRIDLGLVDQECGDLEQAAVHLNAAEQLAESLNDDRAAALVLCSRATLEFSREEYARAEEGFGRAQSRFEEIGLDRHAMLCEGHRADALMRLNRLEFAGDLLEKTVEGARLHAHEHAEYAFLGSLAELRARQGRFDQATWHVEQALRLTCTVPVEQALFFGKTAIVALLCGDENQAREREAEAVRVAQAAGLPAGSAIWQVLRIVGELREQRQPHKG